MDPFSQKNTKLFGLDAQRVSTAELEQIVAELRSLIGDGFERFQAVKSLSVKPDHGDIDIIALIAPNIDLQKFLKARLGPRLLKFSPNGHTKSMLYRSQAGKTVHVDLIVSNYPGKFDSHADYYSYNDFSQVVGVLAKGLHFKYGSEGFFKRFQDVKDLWHDLFITSNLMDGLRILGYTNVKARFDAIRDHDDILRFLVSSPLFDVSFFEDNQMRAVDRQAVRKRKGSEYLYSQIRALNIHRTIDDEDYFFKRLFPQRYEEVELEKAKINSQKPAQSKKYNGGWLMDHFHIKPGPQIGRLLKAMNDKFGEGLEEAPEENVYDFVADQLSQGL